MNAKQKIRLEEVKAKDFMENTDADRHFLRLEHDEKLSEKLREKLKNQTIYTILRSVNKMGDERIIDMFYIENGNPQTIMYQTNQVFDKRDRDKDGYHVNGGGMDMGFSLIASLGYHLFDDYTLLNQEWI